MVLTPSMAMISGGSCPAGWFDVAPGESTRPGVLTPPARAAYLSMRWNGGGSTGVVERATSQR